MTKPGLLPVMIVMLGFVPQPNLQNNVSLLSENTIQSSEGAMLAPRMILSILLEININQQ